MNALMPMPTVTSLRREMDRLFDRFWEGDEFPAMNEWNPLMDLTETKDVLVATLEIPGIDPKDIHVKLENGILTVQGEKHKDIEKKDERWYRMERAYGSFVRSVRLPVTVDPAKVNAAFKNGLLTITLPKVPSILGTEIPVKA